MTGEIQKKDENTCQNGELFLICVSDIIKIILTWNLDHE